MTNKFWLTAGLLGSLRFLAVAQAPPVRTDLIVAPSKGSERTVNRDATPARAELLLYAEPNDGSRTTKALGTRPIHIFSEIDSVWYRTVYGGAQFFVKRRDVTLVEPGARKAPARRR